MSPTSTNVLLKEYATIQVTKDLDDNLDEENIHGQLPLVEEIRAQRAANTLGPCCRMGRTGEIALIVLVSVLLVAIIGLSASYATKINPAPANRIDLVVDFLINNEVSKLADITTEGSPQQFAANWIANQDALNVPIPEDLEGDALGPDGVRFVSRYVSALLYFALDGPNWSSQLNFLSEKEICDWNLIQVADGQGEGRSFRIGITCNNGFVNTLQMSK